MGNTNKFWKGILWGAIAGGAISLLDRDTRRAVVENCKKTTAEITHYIKHPNEAAEKVRESTQQLRSTIEQVSEDVSFIAEKVEELREITPSVNEKVKETQKAFLKRDQQ